VDKQIFMQMPLTAQQLQTFVETIEAATLGLKLLYWIPAVVLSIVSIAIVIYVKKKAENLASKEDLKELTAIVERVKADVQFFGKKQEIHYGYYFEKKAEILASVYGKLRGIQRDLHNAVEQSVDQNGAIDRLIKCRDSLSEFRNFVDDHKIFLEKNIESEIDYILGKLYEILQLSMYSTNLPADQLELKMDLFTRTYYSVGSPMSNTLNSLAAAFQKHINSPSTSDAIKE
jgi:hypothetical protein